MEAVSEDKGDAITSAWINDVTTLGAPNTVGLTEVPNSEGLTWVNFTLTLRMRLNLIDVQSLSELDRLKVLITKTGLSCQSYPSVP